jgi:hypothetical protein
MESSYTTKELDYSSVLKTICFGLNPLTVTEIGIGTGFSLRCFVEWAPKKAEIKAYDLFDGFNGNHPPFEETVKKFPRVPIAEGNFYELHDSIKDNSLDILHIDVANNGETYQFALDNYWEKLTDKGIMILEGGSKDRDQIEWMKKYEKLPIAPVLERNKNKFKILTFGKVPSITLINK